MLWFHILKNVKIYTYRKIHHEQFGVKSWTSAKPLLRASNVQSWADVSQSDLNELREHINRFKPTTVSPWQSRTTRSVHSAEASSRPYANCFQCLAHTVAYQIAEIFVYCWIIRPIYICAIYNNVLLATGSADNCIQQRFVEEPTCYKLHSNHYLGQNELQKIWIALWSA